MEESNGEVASEQSSQLVGTVNSSQRPTTSSYPTLVIQSQSTFPTSPTNNVQFLKRTYISLLSNLSGEDFKQLDDKKIDLKLLRQFILPRDDSEIVEHKFIFELQAGQHILFNTKNALFTLGNERDKHIFRSLKIRYKANDENILDPNNFRSGFPNEDDEIIHENYYISENGVTIVLNGTNNFYEQVSRNFAGQFDYVFANLSQDKSPGDFCWKVPLDRESGRFIPLTEGDQRDIALANLTIFGIVLDYCDIVRNEIPTVGEISLEELNQHSEDNQLEVFPQVQESSPVEDPLEPHVEFPVSGSGSLLDWFENLVENQIQLQHHQPIVNGKNDGEELEWLNQFLSDHELRQQQNHFLSEENNELNTDWLDQCLADLQQKIQKEEFFPRQEDASFVYGMYTASSEFLAIETVNEVTDEYIPADDEFNDEFDHTYDIYLGGNPYDGIQYYGPSAFNDLLWENPDLLLNAGEKLDEIDPF